MQNPITAHKTVLYEHHIARNAKMTEFSGWDMPLQYTKVLEEHHAVRQFAGLFDIAHMGLLSVSCNDYAICNAFLNQLVPQDLKKLYPGKAIYTQLLNEQGGIIDDIIVYDMREQTDWHNLQELLIICNASNADKDLVWIQQQAKQAGISNFKAQLHYQDYALLALQGPRFADTLARTGYNTEHLPKRFHIQAAQIQEAQVLLSRTGYTGEDGVEIIVPKTQAGYLWDLLLELGKPIGLQPVGLAARDTLRLEAAYPLHGHDITEETTPLEAGLGWSVKLDKDENFIGKSVLMAQQEQGLPREFYCFTINKRVIARQHDIIYKNGEPVGEVTSGSISPLFNVPIGMGYIQSHQVSGVGDTIQIRIRNTDVDAELVERPFYQK